MADALASGASVRKNVGVQVPPRPRCPLSGHRKLLNPQYWDLLVGLAGFGSACCGERARGEFAAGSPGGSVCEVIGTHAPAK
jgi:hypothetical protein